ncbi:MAG: hypothetical protein HYV95_01865 [Opitutae bacterium]|nr:hypothetical protein [Opitutae bacterium]
MLTRGLLLCLFIGVVAPVSASDLKIVRVFTGWRDAESFKRIAEYFDGKEHTGGEIVLRTHPGQRGGYYFLVRVSNPGAPARAQFQLQLIEAGQPAQHTTVFPAEVKTGTSVFQLGLTGPEWQNAKAQPVAWQVLILSADDGRVLATEKSYLWEKPVGG